MLLEFGAWVRSSDGRAFGRNDAMHVNMVCLFVVLLTIACVRRGRAAGKASRSPRSGVATRNGPTYLRSTMACLAILVGAAWPSATQARQPMLPAAGGAAPYITPQMLDPRAGTGHDDAAILQQAIDAANGGVLFLSPPPSGDYNICEHGLHLAFPITIIGSGQTSIRVLPSCKNPPREVFLIDTSGVSPATRSRGRILLDNLRIDASGKALYDIFDAYSVGLSLRNSVLRNAAPVHGANFFEVSGYETDIDFSNRLENINDKGQKTYGTANVPDYNIVTYASDGHYSAVGVDAKIANFYQASGGNNDFSHAHGWGYANGNADGQPDLRPLYNFKILGSATLLGSVADSFVESGFFISAATIGMTGLIGDDESGGQLIGARCESNGETKGQCIEIDNDRFSLKHWSILGNDTQGIGGSGRAPIKVKGALDPSTNVAFNGWVAGGSSISVGGRQFGGSSLRIGVDRENAYVSVASDETSKMSNLKLSAAGSGVIEQSAGAMKDTLSPSGRYLAAPLTIGSSGTTTLRASTDAQTAYLSAAASLQAPRANLKISGAGGGTVKLTSGSATLTVQAGSLDSTVPLRGPSVTLTPTTIAMLPLCTTANEGAVGYVNDAKALTYGGAPLGGGVQGTLVVCSRIGSGQKLSWTMH